MTRVLEIVECEKVAEVIGGFVSSTAWTARPPVCS